MLPEDDRSLTLNMKFSTLFSAALLSVVVGSGSADAALVSFLGSVDTGSPVVLGSLPRNFKLTLDYTPAPGGVDTGVTGTLTFPSTPNGNTSNPDVNPEVSVATTGTIRVRNDFGPGVEDIFGFSGTVAAGLLGPNFVNYNFSFLNPSDTVTSTDLSPASIQLLVNGETSIAFSGGPNGFRGNGVIRGAPEPTTMIALCGLVVGGCGVGYRRRKKKSQETTAAA